jgi:hypothetical protein
MGLLVAGDAVEIAYSILKFGISTAAKCCHVIFLEKLFREAAVNLIAHEGTLALLEARASNARNAQSYTGSALGQPALLAPDSNCTKNSFGLTN